MSYEQALQKMRAQGTSVPEFSEVAARPKWKPKVSTTQWLVAFTSVLAAGSFGAVTANEVAEGLAQPDYFWIVFTRGPGMASLLPAVLLLVAARMVLRTRFTSQMLSRAIWWSNLIVGTLMGFLLGEEIHRFAGITAALCCGLALLSIERHGLDGSVEDAAEGTFRPAAFRGLLTLALVMAFADAQTLAFSGILQANFGGLGWTVASALLDSGPTLLAAGVMGLAVFGLLRLRTWALFLNLVANFVIAGLALWGYLGVSSTVAGTLAMTAAVQALLPVPILALAAGGPRAEKSVFIHHGSRFATVTVLVLMMLAGLGFTQRGFRYTGWLDYQGQTHVRGLSGIRTGPGNDFEEHDVRYERLPGLVLDRGSNWTDADVSFAEFQGAVLRRSIWVRTTIVETQFSTADLREASFRDVVLTDVNLRGADLRGALFENVTFEGGDLTGANIEGARFENVTWKSVTCPNRWASDHISTCEGQVAVADRVDGCFAADPDTQRTLNRDQQMRGAFAAFIEAPVESLGERTVVCIDRGSWGNGLVPHDLGVQRQRSKRRALRLTDGKPVALEGPRFESMTFRPNEITVVLGETTLRFGQVALKEPND